MVTLSLSVGLIPLQAIAEDWPISMPWNTPTTPPPEIKPFELPTLKGQAPHFNTPLPALKPAPKIDPDSVFAAISNCYPEKSKFKVDINLVAGMKSSFEQYDASGWPEITEHYVGVVGKMPIYSTTEQARERQWEYQRRTATAKAVAMFAQSLANRNHAYRELGLYLAMEARSQARVQQGIANITEQVTFLEKVATAQRDILKHEATLVEQRLALVAMCDNVQAENVNQYLKQLAHLPVKPPTPEPSEPHSPEPATPNKSVMLP
ncbi:hypothetical protein MHO82_24505 [Vibrio sp. Of7-15]|uniref:hypothetical protein n=1 Tax=Vibrio sp. Of7-15 TaxID=2724879 RepID=UPI001EF1F75C|nr:hypothetical protein [Vibrio sp. Of7-15]MCG7500029.1 hypothetical protein [Vibrio sp. Of7-15]